MLESIEWKTSWLGRICRLAPGHQRILKLDVAETRIRNRRRRHYALMGIVSTPDRI